MNDLVMAVVGQPQRMALAEIRQLKEEAHP